jgi:hypothetical protein
VPFDRVLRIPLQTPRATLRQAVGSTLAGLGATMRRQDE